MKLLKLNCLIILGLLIFACNKQDERLRDFKMGGDFTLINHNGTPFRMKKTEGKIRLLFFGYANCPDFCPSTLNKIKRAVKNIKQSDEKVLTLFVSVDPERDTQEILRTYLKPYSIPVIGLTGSIPELTKVVEQYNGTFYKRESDKKSDFYLVDHTSVVYVIDKSGKVRYLYKYKEKPELLSEIIEALL